MATAQMGTVLRHIHQLAGGAAPERTDRQLLDDFAGRRDEAAFTALVARHGAMVLRVCRRVLGHEQDAEDAFQATFLVLAGAAATIRRREALAGWLHGVAHRTALKARRTAARRRAREGRPRSLAPPSPPGLLWEEVRTVLDEELGRLAEPFRSAFVLCALEGMTGPEAAAALGCKEATLYTRMNRARRLLQKALAARGIELAALLGALAIADGAAMAAPATLVRAAIRFGLLVAAGEPAAAIPTHVAALAAGVTRAMFLIQSRIATALLLVIGLLAAGAGGLACRALAATEPEAKPAAPSSPAPAAKGKGKVHEAEGKEAVTLTGRVLDPDGKPVAGARLYLLGGRGKDTGATEVQAAADQDGRFRLTAAVDQSQLVAVADGYGPAWTSDFKNPDGLTLRLVADDVPITGRILDLQGKPVAGVTLRPHALKASPTGKLDDWLEAAKTRKDGVSLEYEKLSVSLRQNRLADLFPRITTGADGRFQSKGVGRERVVALIVEGPTVQTQEINVATRTGMIPLQLPSWDSVVGLRNQIRYHGANLEHVSPPCRPVAGIVRDRATGRPIAGAVVRGEETVGNPFYRVQTTTDAEGRYRLTGLGKAPEGEAVSVVAVGPEGRPYLGMRQRIGGPGLEPVTLDFPLKTGVWVQGQVTDKATGRGVPALLSYFVFEDSLQKGEAQELFIPFKGGDRIDSDQQGRFRFVGYPGRGLLGARATGPGMEHYRISLGATEIKNSEQYLGMLRFPTFPFRTFAGSADAWKAINPTPGAETVTCPLVLDPGRPLRVRVEGPGGKPLEGVSVHGRFARQMWSGAGPAEFPVHGLEEGKGRTLLLRHPQKGLAGLREIKGDESGLVVVRLQPAGSIRGRLLKDDGRPWRHVQVLVLFTRKDRPGMGFEHAPEKVRADAEGRFRIDGLIPDVEYHALILDGIYPREVFPDTAVASGQARDLGDVTPKKARDAE
jgi:RNA polymerase sigma factor (sigma-70 family)